MKRTRTVSNPKKATSTKVQKTAYKQALYKQPKNNVRLVKRNVNYATLVGASAVGTGFGFQFTLSQVPNFAEFTAMYDTYKINAVELCFYPKQTQSTSTLTAGNVDNVRILTAIDYSDNVPPISGDEIREYENCEVHSVLDTFKVYVPSVKIVDAASSVRTSYISTTSAGTRWYGLRGWIEPLQFTTGNYGWVVEAVFYMSFKNLK